MIIETVTYFICPTCEKELETEGRAEECCQAERNWRDMWKDVQPGTAVYVEKEDGSSYITHFEQTSILADVIMRVHTKHQSDCVIRYCRGDLENTIIRLATKEDMIQR